jgi:hypothetical protein
VWLILSIVAGGVVISIVGLAQFNVWGMRPAVQELSGPHELERYIKSWGQWLEERGRIVVQHAATGREAEFRKRRYRSRPDALVFRVRNADSGKQHFARMQAALDAAGVQYQTELTPKRRQPRAIAVALDPSDLLAPLAAVRLIIVVFELDAAVDRALRVWVEGRIRTSDDAPAIERIPSTQAEQSGVRVGSFLGRLLRFRPHAASYDRSEGCVDQTHG